MLHKKENTFENEVQLLTENEEKNITAKSNIPKNDIEIFDWCLEQHNKKEFFSNGNRNNYITKLAFFCNDYGVSELTCLSECNQFIKEDFALIEIETTIKNVYKNHYNNHGTQKYVSKSEFIQNTKQVEPKPKIINIPIFPIEVFPQKIQQIINELHDKLQFQYDLISAGILSTVSTATGNSFELLHNNHINKAIVWCVSVAEKGKGKSEPQKWCKKPFHDIDFMNKKEFDKKVKIWNEYYELNKSEKEKYESSNNKPEKSETTRHLQHVLGDYNPETLYRVHDINKRGILLFSDEIMRWINSFDRYNKSGEQQFLNELWNGTTANYDRVANSIFISNCFVNVLGTIQTLFLKSLSANNRTIDGFLERLLYFYPNNFLKTKPNGKILEDRIYNDYKKIIDELLSCQYEFWEDGQIKPQRITMEQGAGIRFNQWLNDFIDKQNNTTNENEKAILAKLEIYCYRFSLLLQLLFWACGEADNKQVELKAVEGAIKMVDYFHLTALKVYETIGSNSKSEITEKDLLLLIRKKTGHEYKKILDFIKSEISEGTFRQWINRSK